MNVCCTFFDKGVSYELVLCLKNSCCGLWNNYCVLESISCFEKIYSVLWNNIAAYGLVVNSIHDSKYEFARATEAVAKRCSVKKMLFEISRNSQENTCVRDSFLIKSLAQVFSFEFWGISKNTFFYRTPPAAASGANLGSEDAILFQRNVRQHSSFIDLSSYSFQKRS